MEICNQVMIGNDQNLNVLPFEADFERSELKSSKTFSSIKSANMSADK